MKIKKQNKIRTNRMTKIKDMIQHKKYVVSDFFDEDRNYYFIRESDFDSKLIKNTDKLDSELFKEEITVEEILSILEKQHDAHIGRFLNNLIRNDKYIRLNIRLSIKEV